MTVQLALCSLLLALLLVESAVGRPAVNALSNGTADPDDHRPRNNRVLIGILSQNSDPSPRGESYIAASYVKFVEAAGARVVPFLHDLPKHEIRRR